jgi:hypothetical protein
MPAPGGAAVKTAFKVSVRSRCQHGSTLTVHAHDSISGRAGRTANDQGGAQVANPRSESSRPKESPSLCQEGRTTCDTRPATGCDCVTEITLERGQQLYAAGYGIVGRYLDEHLEPGDEGYLGGLKP